MSTRDVVREMVEQCLDAMDRLNSVLTTESWTAGRSRVYRLVGHHRRGEPALLRL